MENVETVRRLLEAGNRDDLDTAVTCLDPEVEWIPARAATEGVYHGHEGFIRFVKDTRENFDTFEPHFALRDLGERVLAWGTITVRGRGSGVELEVPVGSIFEFRAGRVVRWEDFGSREAALEAAAG